jgi:peptide/nickel transport system substrate-binding protein
MNSTGHRTRLEAARSGRSELESHVIDEFIAGRISRRELVRRGTVVGMSLSVLGTIVTACGGSDSSSRSASSGTPASKKRGGTIRSAIVTPTGAVDPVAVGDTGGAVMLQQTGQYLSVSSGDLKLVPVLAESWKPNRDASEWTFKLKPGVTFNDGSPMTADDVVFTFDMHSDPKVGSNALSAFSGVLSKGGTRKVDDHTVAFTLDAPNGNFPYIVSSDNYNAVILPRTYKGKFDKKFPGTGPWIVEKYTPKVGATFIRNPNYWDKARAALPDRSEFTFYTDEQPQIVALQGGQVDVVGQFSVQGGRALLEDPNVKVISLRSSACREVHMRVDMDPLKDKRVRQAIALSLDRKGIIDGLFQGKADPGNDNWFAPVFASTDTSIPQREKNVEMAKQLLADAGMADGFTVKMNTQRVFEIPDLGVLIQNGAKEIGVKIDLVLQDQSSYYGDFTYGNSPWLDSIMGITDYGHRGVPNVFLQAPLLTKGTWNAAHFKDPTYDKLVAQYVAAIDVQSQKAVAGKIEQLLLDETPIILPYFFNFLSATASNISGVQTTATGLLFLDQASIA